VHSALGRISVGLAVLVGVAGFIASVPVSGFLSSLFFYALVGGLIAAFGLDLADRRSGRR
jgi:fructose-specific phosphotransferase system IIC component